MTAVLANVSAGPLRRLGAILYDALLLIAVLIAATMPFLPFAAGKVLVPSEVGFLAYIYWSWQLLVIALYFALFWRKKGSTVGMQAWRMRVERIDGRAIRWGDALKRIVWAALPWAPSFVTLTIAGHVSKEASNLRQTFEILGYALLALGFGNYMWAYLDPQRRAWHDRFLETRVVKV